MIDYILREDIYIDPDHDQHFNYSDGDEAEAYLLELTGRVQDLSTGSEELMAGIRDWSSLYHLSPKRANLLRPLAESLTGRTVLEIGSGCGAITRYLGELDCRVIAIEGSYRRAKITRQRCRDLSNIKVICDNFEDFYVPEKFDVVTLIGVLEYSNLFIHAVNPAEAMLEKARRFLKPGGHVIIAIENKLGLKYLAGAPEDHLDKPYFGIENKYSSSTAVTFGKTELKEILKGSGFLHASFLYPFPDYKLPSVILTERGIGDDSFLIEELLAEKLEYFQDHSYTNNFSTTLAVEAFTKNKLLSHFSNSFLIITSPDKDKDILLRKSLAYTYSSHRKKPFCKENIFERDSQGQVMVIKKKIFDVLPEQQLPIQQKIENEIYYEGILLSKHLVTQISRNGWTIEDLRPWVHVYYTILNKYSIIKDLQPVLEGKYADLTPFNILLKNGSDVHIFDQEWIINEELPLHYVLFRGVRFSLGAISFFSPPADGVPLNLLELSVAIINTTFNFTTQMLNDCLEKEKKYFSPVNFEELHSFDCGNIRIRGDYTLEKQLQAELDSTKIEASRLRAQMDRTNHLAEDEKKRSRLLEQEKDWYIRTYERRSLLGLIKDRLPFFRKNHTLPASERG